jgi:hypothetical protein
MTGENPQVGKFPKCRAGLILSPCPKPLILAMPPPYIFIEDEKSFMLLVSYIYGTSSFSWDNVRMSTVAWDNSFWHCWKRITKMQKKRSDGVYETHPCYEVHAYVWWLSDISMTVASIAMAAVSTRNLHCPSPTATAPASTSIWISSPVKSAKFDANILKLSFLLFNAIQLPWHTQQ